MAFRGEPTDPHNAPKPAAVPTNTRVDAAHVKAGEPIAPPAAPASTAQSSAAQSSAAQAPDPQPLAWESQPVVTAQQIRLQAAQLATYLQRQQSSVDHRESEINARVAAIENQVRAARLWLDERHAELGERQAELDEREAALRRREAELTALARECPELLGEELAARAAELDERQAELYHAASRLGESPSHPVFENEAAAATAQALESYRSRLERAEKLLEAEQIELERQRRDLAATRAAFSTWEQAERQRYADEQARALAEHERLHQELVKQHGDLAARRDAVERMRLELNHAQQEVLEMRLATEETWARLRGAMAPEELVQSLAETRMKLADQQRLSRQELAAERQELQELVSRLADERNQLAVDRREIQSWVRHRGDELAEQAALLAQRERELVQQQAEQNERAARWQAERTSLENELRKLLRQVPRKQNAAA